MTELKVGDEVMIREDLHVGDKYGARFCTSFKACYAGIKSHIAWVHPNFSYNGGDPAYELAGIEGVLWPKEMFVNWAKETKQQKENEQMESMKGLKPKATHQKDRFIDVVKAILEYAENDLVVPVEWIDECNELYEALFDFGYSIWDAIDDEFKYIAKDDSGKWYAYSRKPECIPIDDSGEYCWDISFYEDDVDELEYIELKDLDLSNYIEFKDMDVPAYKSLIERPYK
jgi:hypothetical protein